MTPSTNYPDWVYKVKQKGTAIMKRGNNFYLYKVKSVWNKKKGRAQYKTEAYLGKITPDGLIKPKSQRMSDNITEKLHTVTVKEYGASFFMNYMCDDLLEQLKKYYPDLWKEIFVFASLRLHYTTPIKNLQFYYETSFFSEMYPYTYLSDKQVGQMLREIGLDRNTMSDFMKNFVKGTEYAAIDLTHVFSLSENVISVMPGHNDTGEYLPQINLFYLFSIDKMKPVYYRMIAGSVTSVTSLKIAVDESGATNTVLIGDKGFYSESNVEKLKDALIHYILPLKRDSKKIEYRYVKEENKEMKFFMFQDRPIWYKKEEKEGETIILYQDPSLKTEEEKNQLMRINKMKDEEKEKEIKEFQEMRHRLGTISVITDVKEEGERIYELLKLRIEIEQLYDTLKNLLNADRTYMRDEYEMEGWMFVNFIAIMIYYSIYNKLVEHDILSKYSPKDVLTHLSRIHGLKIGNGWILSEVPRKSRVVMEKLKIPLVEYFNSFTNKPTDIL